MRAKGRAHTRGAAGWALDGDQVSHATSLPRHVPHVILTRGPSMEIRLDDLDLEGLHNRKPITVRTKHSHIQTPTATHCTLLTKHSPHDYFAVKHLPELQLPAPTSMKQQHEVATAVPWNHLTDLQTFTQKMMRQCV